MGGPALVGREEQLRRLDRVLDETFAGIGRLVLVSGEPGVGKTRLALEVLDRAAGRGARTAVGTCWDGAGAPGLWPWVQVLRSLGDGNDDGAFPRAPDFHLFEATLQRLTRTCTDAPLVVLLDDLQWADAGSLALTDFLHRHAVHLPLLLLGTMRPGDEALALSDLAQKAFSVPLEGLDNDAIRELRDSLGVPTSTAEAEHLRRLTGGNPFFVIESVAFRDPAESLGVRRAIDRRVETLSDDAQHVLTVAALLGLDVPDAMLRAVVGNTTSALAEIERSGLMHRDVGRHAFVHDLVRETLRDRLGEAERRALQARIVDAAASTPALATCLLPAQLAFLAAEAVPDVSPERARHLLVAAADDASARLAHEAAGRHLAQAAALADDPDERSALLLRSGDAHRLGGALPLARRQYEGLLASDDVAVRARALLGLHQLGDPAGGREPSEVVRRLDAVDLRTIDDPTLRAAILAARSRSRTHLLADDRSDAAPMAREALAVARTAADGATLASCLLAHHDAIWEPGTEDERRTVADELARTGRHLADHATEAQGLLLRMVAELELGDARYRTTHDEFQSVAAASHSPRLLFVAASRRGTIATLRGDFAQAIVEVDAARALGERIGEPDVLGVWCDQRWQIARHARDDDTIAALVTMLRDLGDPHWVVYEAIAAADTGDADAGRRVARAVADLGERWPRWAARLWDGLLVDLAVLEGDEGQIGELVERLEPDAGHWAVLGGGVLVNGPVTGWLGRLEAARADFERAAARASEAEAAADHLGADLWRLDARADRLVAETVLGVADPGEVATTLATALGRGLRRITARLEALAPAPATVPTANVFRRDHDVWTLAFDGIEVRLPDAKGLRDLHTLLSHPGVEVPATALATEAFVPTDAAPVLDARAKAAYRQRLDRLDDDLDRAAARGDAAKADALEAEREALLDELRRAAGLGGRDRLVNDDRERLRKTVTARIRDTLRRLDDRHPAIAAHLRSSVRTGAVCVYAPPAPMRWELV